VRILQLVPAFHRADAIGNNALTIRNYFRYIGLTAEIFCIESDPELSGEALTYKEFVKYDSAKSIVILHYALPSILNDVFKKAQGRKILVYHNITPPEFLQGYPQYQRLARAGRHSLEELSDVPIISPQIK